MQVMAKHIAEQPLADPNLQASARQLCAGMLWEYDEE